MLPTDLVKTQSYKYDGKDIGKFIDVTTQKTSTRCSETGRVRSITSNVYTFERMTIYGEIILANIKVIH